jgi:hypothetical protein
MSGPGDPRLLELAEASLKRSINGLLSASGKHRRSFAALPRVHAHDLKIDGIAIDKKHFRVVHRFIRSCMLGHPIELYDRSPAILS